MAEKKESTPGSGAAFQGFSTGSDLESIRKKFVAFRDERGWLKFHSPRNILLDLVAEVGEVSEHFQWKDEVPRGLPGWTEKEKEALADELSDVLMAIVSLADGCHVDLAAAFDKKMEKNVRKYPAERVFGNAKKYNEYEEWKGEGL